ncbi:LicD family protein [Butyrivibrio sp. INlla14]|uniref:LicD family protein n=1 Tax=Butyrivibrio sp. INlla14 TaxID=1520808 RepID=UPI0008766C3F|nr:LicD family protein [Butyrivibrio sp. INlla14]SCY71563.1 lipopolysaccharide cholinephosphotransferase [Butyrivibrio sp. INlla14]
MLTFPESFFKDEIRSGFNVPEMMKRCWAAHLKILEELKVLFAKYDLTYYADFGTLLGAVRHGGIIPWDDDVDISMPRADFMKLMEHADEIGGGLTIRSVYNTETFVNFHAVATHKTDTLKWDDVRMQEYYGCPFICYIDIFPMDYIPRDPEKKKLMKQLYSYTYKMVHTCVEVEQEYNGGALIAGKNLPQLPDQGAPDGKLQDFIDQLKDLEDYLHRFYNGTITIDGQKSLRNQLALAAEAIASSCPENEAGRVDYCPHMAYLQNDLSREKEWVKTTNLVPFENTQIAVPAMYHEVLVSRFGEDYMTPVHAASTHP